MSQTFTSFQDFRRRYPIRPNDEGSLLGSGTYGRVIKVEDQLETEWVAIKISEFKGTDAKSLRAEVELAKRIPRQTNIARYDACYRLETDTSVSDFAIMKYYSDGNLADLLRRLSLTAEQVYDITKGILLGLQHLHRHRIVHRDFKPANILISRDNAGRFIPKIADFGLSKLVSDDELDSSDFDLSDGRGTPSYKAPEQIEGSRVSFNLDLWAFGVILYEILTGEKPFKADQRNSSEQSARREIEKKIITVDLPTRLNDVAEPYQTMIRRCLVRDIHERVRKETELLDLLDSIPQLLNEAQKLASAMNHQGAIMLYEQILAKRENHAEALQQLEQCRQQLSAKQVTDLLQEANQLVYQEQFEAAKVLFEQILQLSPKHQEAAHGLVVCIDRLRPKPKVVLETESTDAYQIDTYHEERTDAYIVPPLKASINQPVQTKAEADVTDVNPTKSRQPEPMVRLAEPPKPPTGVPYKPILVGVVLVSLAGLGYYVWGTGSTPTSEMQKSTADSVTIVSPTSAGKSEYSVPNPIPAIPNESKNDLKQRIDVALAKARQAYLRENYELALTFTRSALLLDQSRKDVSSLQNIIEKKLAEKQPEDKPESKNPPIAESNPKPPATEESKPEMPKATPVDPQKVAQQQYDQQLEDGEQAIINGNKKNQAISTFQAARTQASENKLNTAKAEELYIKYLNKAHRIFDRNDYEGAKEWYKVAQALKDTPEVRARINRCNNQ